MNKFTEEVAEYLGVEQLQIVFWDDIIDETRLSIVGSAIIEINKKFELSEYECKKSIAHELRHAFPIYYAQLMNGLSNLRYGSRKENILDVYYQGKRWGKLSIEMMLKKF